MILDGSKEEICSSLIHYIEWRESKPTMIPMNDELICVGNIDLICIQLLSHVITKYFKHVTNITFDVTLSKKSVNYNEIPDSIVLSQLNIKYDTFKTIDNDFDVEMKMNDNNNNNNNNDNDFGDEIKIDDDLPDGYSMFTNNDALIENAVKNLCLSIKKTTNLKVLDLTLNEFTAACYVSVLMMFNNDDIFEVIKVNKNINENNNNNDNNDSKNIKVLTNLETLSLSASILSINEQGNDHEYEDNKFGFEHKNNYYDNNYSYQYSDNDYSDYYGDYYTTPNDYGYETKGFTKGNDDIHILNSNHCGHDHCGHNHGNSNNNNNNNDNNNNNNKNHNKPKDPPKPKKKKANTLNTKDEETQKYILGPQDDNLYNLLSTKISHPWQCNLCTLINPKDSSICGACGQQRYDFLIHDEEKGNDVDIDVGNIKKLYENNDDNSVYYHFCNYLTYNHRLKSFTINTDQNLTKGIKIINKIIYCLYKNPYINLDEFYLNCNYMHLHYVIDTICLLITNKTNNFHKFGILCGAMNEISVTKLFKSFLNEDNKNNITYINPEMYLFSLISKYNKCDSVSISINYLSQFLRKHGKYIEYLNIDYFNGVSNAEYFLTLINKTIVTDLVCLDSIVFGNLQFDNNFIVNNLCQFIENNTRLTTIDVKLSKTSYEGVGGSLGLV